MARAVSLLVVLAACGGSKQKPISNQASPSANGYASCAKVTGVVVNAQNKPVQAVPVELVGGADGQSDIWQSDADGSFTVTATIRRDKLRLHCPPMEALEPPFTGCEGLRIVFDCIPSEF